MMLPPLLPVTCRRYRMEQPAAGRRAGSVAPGAAAPMMLPRRRVDPLSR